MASHQAKIKASAKMASSRNIEISRKRKKPSSGVHQNIRKLAKRIIGIHRSKQLAYGGGS